MRLVKLNWKIITASTFAASAMLLTGCDSPTVGNESASPDEGSNTNEPADVEIEAPGMDVEIESDQDGASVDVDVPDEVKSDAVDIDVNSPE